LPGYGDDLEHGLPEMNADNVQTLDHFCDLGIIFALDTKIKVTCERAAIIANDTAHGRYLRLVYVGYSDVSSDGQTKTRHLAGFC
jgi:hypothetical protein